MSDITETDKAGIENYRRGRGCPRKQFQGALAPLSSRSCAPDSGVSPFSEHRDGNEDKQVKKPEPTIAKIQRLFRSPQRFWRAVAFYLKRITGHRCQFRFQEFDGSSLILEIVEPAHFYKCIKFNDFLRFFNKLPCERSERLRSEAGSDLIFLVVIVMSTAEPTSYPDSLRVSAQAIHEDYLPHDQTRVSDFKSTFKDFDNEPEEMDMDSVIGYAFYLITHVGVGSHFETRVTRSWGVLYDLDPSELLSEEEFNELASEIAEKLDMVWDPVEGVLEYGDDSTEDYDWVSVWKLGEYLNAPRYEEWRSELSGYYLEFLGILWSKTWVLHHPPPFEDMLEEHDFYDVAIVSECIPSDLEEWENVEKM